MSRTKKEKLPLLLIPLGIVIVYFATHLFNLTGLPVFADESIYIRWSQLIIDDWKQYLFFAMNDGKTPLHIWLMVPFQFMFKDQLLAARFFSVIIGFLQVITIAMIVKLLGGRTKTQWLSAVFVVLLPFWFFHHRMALMDGMLTLLLSVTVYGVIKLTQIPPIKDKDISFSKIFKNHGFLTKKEFIIIMFTGLSFGLAILTKIPAILFLPALPVFALLPKISTNKQRFILLAKISLTMFVGLLVFASFKIHPAFGQLFNRGGDFLFTIPEILAGEWRISIKNAFKFTNDISFYLTWPILAFNFAGLFLNKSRRTQITLILASIAFLAPIMILGRVVYPRYLMPVAIFLTIGAAISIQAIVDKLITKQKNILIEAFFILVLVQLVAIIFMTSIDFIAKATLSPNNTPFVAKDQMQYLHEWSSGHGISETIEYIQEESQDKKIIVATEGYFGTLPDALLMYLHRTDVKNIFIEGIGQPVQSIPDEFIEKSQEFDKAILVVNSHRMNMNLSDNLLIKEYCRPDNAPCLQIWDISHIITPSVE